MFFAFIAYGEVFLDLDKSNYVKSINTARFGDLMVWKFLTRLTDVVFVYTCDHPHGTLVSQFKGLLNEALH